MPEKNRYVVKSPLEHNQEKFNIGDTVQLTEKEAAPLLGHTVLPPGEALKDAAVVGVHAESLQQASADLQAERDALAKERAEFEKQKADAAKAVKK